jgi:TatD DNase family protein
MVAYTLRAIAEVKHVGVAEMCAAVTAAGERAFGPWPR